MNEGSLNKMSSHCHQSQEVTIIERSRGVLRLRELWDYRELLYFFIWRDIKIRYKQTAIGAGWAVFQPLLTMVVFTAVFAKLTKMPSDGLPYPLFSYAALLPWNYFSRSLSQSVGSVVENAHLITKVYFPRLLLPISACLSGLIDAGISFVFLLALMFWYGIRPSLPGLVVLPFAVLATVCIVLSVSLWLAVINVRYRDVGQGIPFLIQVWLFVSPVVYPTSMVPEKWRFVYYLNPVTGVIEVFRWALLQKSAPQLGLMIVSMAFVLASLWAGLIFFKRFEKTFADVI